MSILPWFEANPHWLEREVYALTEADIKFKIDDAIKAKGILRINLMIEGTNPAFKFENKEKSVDLVAVYPDLFPYFRPEIYAYDLELPRHQNLVDKNLCLIPRSTESWSPEWTLAAYLKAQLSKVLLKGTITDPKLIAEDEEEQAEPVSDYYQVLPTPVIFDEFSSEINETEEVKYLGKTIIGIPKKMEFPKRLAVLEIVNPKGNVSKLPDSFQKIFSPKFEGLLYSFPKPPPVNPKEALEYLKKELSHQKQRLIFPKKPLQLKDDISLTGVIGLGFPEELTPGQLGTGWLFLIVLKIKKVRKNFRGKLIIEEKEVAHYVRAIRVNSNDVQVRIPKLKPLIEKKIAIVGLGALGAPSAIELARCRIDELKLWDFDFIEPATTVRWPLGLSEAGLMKTNVIKEFIELNYPTTKVEIFNRRIGSVRIDGKNEPNPSEVMEQEEIEKLFSGVSLIYDASAEVGISHYLSMEAKKRHIPFVSIYATPGVMGGLVMRVVPNKTKGCWMCLQYAKENKEIPIPLSDPKGEIQPPGCGDITFTGSGFDLQNVSLAGVRMAVSTLCDDYEKGYPNFEGDVSVLSLFNEKGNAIMPSWQSFPLLRQANCPYCAEK